MYHGNFQKIADVCNPKTPPPPPPPLSLQTCAMWTPPKNCGRPLWTATCAKEDKCSVSNMTQKEPAHFAEPAELTVPGAILHLVELLLIGIKDGGFSGCL